MILKDTFYTETLFKEKYVQTIGGLAEKQKQ